VNVAFRTWYSPKETRKNDRDYKRKQEKKKKKEAEKNKQSSSSSSKSSSSSSKSKSSSSSRNQTPHRKDKKRKRNRSSSSIVQAALAEAKRYEAEDKALKAAQEKKKREAEEAKQKAEREKLLRNLGGTSSSSKSSSSKSSSRSSSTSSKKSSESSIVSAAKAEAARYEQIDRNTPRKKSQDPKPSKPSGTDLADDIGGFIGNLTGVTKYLQSDDYRENRAAKEAAQKQGGILGGLAEFDAGVRTTTDLVLDNPNLSVQDNLRAILGPNLSDKEFARERQEYYADLTRAVDEGVTSTGLFEGKYTRPAVDLASEVLQSPFVAAGKTLYGVDISTSDGSTSASPGTLDIFELATLGGGSTAKNVVTKRVDDILGRGDTLVDDAGTFTTRTVDDAGTLTTRTVDDSFTVTDDVAGTTARTADDAGTTTSRIFDDATEAATRTVDDTAPVLDETATTLFKDPRVTTGGGIVLGGATVLGASTLLGGDTSGGTDDPTTTDPFATSTTSITATSPTPGGTSGGDGSDGGGGTDPSGSEDSIVDAAYAEAARYQAIDDALNNSPGWAPAELVDYLSNGWNLMSVATTDGTETRFFVVAPGESSSKFLDQTGVEQTYPNTTTIESLPFFATEGAARDAHKLWVAKNVSGGGTVPEDGAVSEGGASAWSQWEEVQTIAPWRIFHRTDGESDEYLASSVNETGDNVYLDYDGSVAYTPKIYTDLDALDAALVAYYEKLDNGEIAVEDEPTGGSPNKELIERDTEKTTTATDSTSVVEKLTDNKVALAALGVGAVVMLGSQEAE
jgi:hypothetical protein